MDTAQTHADKAKLGKLPKLPKDLADLRLLRPSNVAEVLACSRSHVYRLAKAGELPPPVRISHGVSGWRALDVMALIDRRIKSAAEAA